MVLVNAPDFHTSEVRGLRDKLVLMLQTVRTMSGLPIHVTSGLRPDNHDGDVAEHETGWGVDIADNSRGLPLGSRWRHEVLKAAYAVGFPRIGIYDRHIHLGLSEARDQDVSWWGISS